MKSGLKNDDGKVLSPVVFKTLLCCIHTKQQNMIVFVWSQNGANKTRAFVKGLLEPEMKIVGGATY